MCVYAYSCVCVGVHVCRCACVVCLYVCLYLCVCVCMRVCEHTNPSVSKVVKLSNKHFLNCIRLSNHQIRVIPNEIPVSVMQYRK